MIEKGDCVSVFYGKTVNGKSQEMLAEVVNIIPYYGKVLIEVEIVEECEAPMIYKTGDIIQVNLDSIKKI